MPNHNVSATEIFKRDYGEDYPDQRGERPSTELKMRIRPNLSNIPKQLKTELWNDHNLELSQSNSDKNIVIVFGIPPDNGFGEQEVMEVVRRHAPEAVVVPE